MKFKELTTKSVDELKKDLAGMQEKLQNLKLKTKLGQTKNVREGRQLKKDIARILTHFRAN